MAVSYFPKTSYSLFPEAAPEQQIQVKKDDLKWGFTAGIRSYPSCSFQLLVYHKQSRCRRKRRKRKVEPVKTLQSINTCKNPNMQ